jgi:2-oxo-3-hexenedioate decarboxylase/2-keto-4-pentenoate hydratase
MDQDAIEEAARLLARARLEHAPLDALPEACRPGDEAAAYAVQACLHGIQEAAGLGARLGWKIGCTTPVMQGYMGIDHPCAGGLFASTITQGGAQGGGQSGAEAGAEGPVRHAFDDFCRVGVECEIVVRLGADLPAAAAPYDRATVAGAVAACMAGIEVVDDRFRNFRQVDVWTMAAGDFFNAGGVLGTPIADFDPLALDALTGRMTVNGAAAGAGRGGDILGHPLEALAWLANLKAGQGEALAAGEIVMLGSVVETKWLTRGDVVEIEIESLGTASVVFE